jgi:mannitol-1-phosphate 5-dehydrogenase
MKKKNILIYGAGAVGRGYIPWVFRPEDYDFHYVESNPSLCKTLNQQKIFTSFKTGPNGYEPLKIKIQNCFRPGEEKSIIGNMDAIVTAVGPRSFLSLRQMLTGIKIPVICCENDSSLPETMRNWTNNPNVVFAIPDVIASSTAHPDLLEQDPLSIITEAGECFIEDTAAHLPANCSYVDNSEMARQWSAKLYIHNTPHCIAAYLGSLIGAKYLHNAMENKEISITVEGAMNEMAAMLKAHNAIDENFINYYRDKELSRFRNTLLCDPIARVAREPFRKLAPNERLIGAAQLCLSVGIVPQNILVGIMAAFCFERDEDPDAHIKILRRSLAPREFLRTIFKLRESEALFLLLIAQWDDILRKIERLKR